MKTKLSVFFLLLFALVFCSSSYANEIVLKNARVGKGFEATLLGSGFGKACGKCEVIIDYGKGQRYAAKILGWSSTSIKLIVPNVGLGDRVKLQVKTPRGESSAISYKINPMILPKKNVNHSVKSNTLKGLEVHSFSYDAKLGGKGKDKINVSVNRPKCGEEVWVFDRGNIVFKSKRFGDAKIQSSPKRGCIKCSPLAVKWYHEPTGRIDYQVHIYKRKIVGLCSSLKR